MSLASDQTPVRAKRERHNRPSPGQLDRARTGCNQARAGLLREIEGPCYRFCLAQLACRESARDATQETAMRVLRSLHRYRAEAAFLTWALSIALNVCREHRRKRRWLALPGEWFKADPSPGPHRRAEHAEQTSQLMALLQQLPARQREAVSLRYLHGLNTEETAKAMRCSTGTVKATLAKALSKLRQQWEVTDAQAYPGDLAQDVLQQERPSGLLIRVRYPAFATAAIALGVITVFALTQSGSAPESAPPELAAKPAPALPEITGPGVTTPQPSPGPAEPLPPTEPVATTKLPEIDRDLLPLQRNSQATWLASAAIPQQQLEKQTRLAQHPDTKQRAQSPVHAKSTYCLDDDDDDFDEEEDEDDDDEGEEWDEDEEEWEEEWGMEEAMFEVEILNQHLEMINKLLEIVEGSKEITSDPTSTALMALITAEDMFEEPEQYVFFMEQQLKGVQDQAVRRAIHLQLAEGYAELEMPDKVKEHLSLLIQGKN
eukprot:g13369.t1